MSSSRWLLRIGIRGWWSVTTMKCGRPAKKKLALGDGSRHGQELKLNDGILYLDPVSERNLEHA